MLLNSIQILSERPLGQDGKVIKIAGVIQRTAVGALLEKNSRAVCAAFVKLLEGKIAAGKFRKVSIYVNYTVPKSDYTINDGVVGVYENVDLGDYERMALFDRQVLLVKLVSKNLKRIFLKFGLDSEVLTAASIELLGIPICNLFLGKIFKNNENKMSARVEVLQDLEKSTIKVVLKYIGNTYRYCVASSSPDEFIFQMFFGEIIWKDSERIVLRTLNSEDYEFNLGDII